MFALLLQNAEDLQNARLPEAWAKLKSVPFSEAALHIRKSWGCLESSVAQEEAERLSAGLRAAGVAVRVRPSSDLISAPSAEPVKTLSLSSEELKVSVPSEEERCPWLSISGLFACALNETMTKTTKTTEGPSAGQQIAKAGLMLATGLPLPLGRKKTVEKTETHRELTFALDVLAGSPVRRFRIDGQHLDYSFLGAKKEAASQLNFRILLDELRARAPQAFLNKGARILASRQPVATMGYESFLDLDCEIEWFLSTH